LSFPLIALLVFAATNFSCEREFLEDDIVLPKDYAWQQLLVDLQALPIDLNRAALGELLQIPFLSTLRAQQVLDYRDSVKSFPGLDQLAAAGVLDSEVIQRIRPYVSFSARAPKVRGRVNLRSCLSDLSRWAGFTDHRQSERIRAELGDFGFSLVGAKDPGEQDVFDLLAGGFEYRYHQAKLIAGDFEVHSGQGLIFARPHSFWLSATGQRVPWAPTFALPNTLAENTLFQGIAGSQRFGPIALELFASRNRLDAAHNSDSSVRNISYEGTHDDSAAIANRGRLLEELLGGRLGLRGANLGLAVDGYCNRYDRPIRPGPKGTGFSGLGLSVAAFELAYQSRNYRLGTELARTTSRGYSPRGYSPRGYSPRGWAGGLDLSGDWSELVTHLNLAYLQSDFYSPHSRDRSLQRIHDELEGTFHTSWRWQRWQGRLYATTARDFLLDSMPARLELGLDYHGLPLGFGLRWKQSYKDELPGSAGSRLDLSYQLTSLIEVGFRYEDRFKWSRLNDRGTAVAAAASLMRPGFELEARLIRFWVSQRECRLYSYEPGFPGNNVSFDRNGWRAYAASTVRIQEWLKLGAKLGVSTGDHTVLDGALNLETRFGS
jgi:hypothetical protein